MRGPTSTGPTYCIGERRWPRAHLRPLDQMQCLISGPPFSCAFNIAKLIRSLEEGQLEHGHYREYALTLNASAGLSYRHNSALPSSCSCYVPSRCGQESRLEPAKRTTRHAAQAALSTRSVLLTDVPMSSSSLLCSRDEARSEWTFRWCPWGLLTVIFVCAQLLPAVQGVVLVHENMRAHQARHRPVRSNQPQPHDKLPHD